MAGRAACTADGAWQQRRELLGKHKDGESLR